VVLALPLPTVPFDHQRGLLNDSPARASLEDHASLDCAAGAEGATLGFV